MLSGWKMSQNKSFIMKLLNELVKFSADEHFNISYIISGVSRKHLQNFLRYE